MNRLAAFACAIFFSFFIPAILYGAESGENFPVVGVGSAIVYDLDDDVILFEQNADQRIPPASLTKVMSLFLALDFIGDGHATMDTPVRVSAAAAHAGGSSMGLRPNEVVPFSKLLLGMAVSSGNDASFAVAEKVGGSASNFVKMMNARAWRLGMRDSHFQNPHGLPAAGQYTTARDMLALARAYLKAHPGALDLHNTKLLTHGGYTSWNKNPLLGQYPGADGLKTGWIRASGYNLIFTASRGSKRLLAVILGAPDVFTRGGEACRLLDAGFLACANDGMSMSDALCAIPFDGARIDPLKTGRDAGLLRAKKHASRKAPAINKNRTGRGVSLLPSPKSVARKQQAAKKENAAKTQPKRGQHAQSRQARTNRS